MPGDCIPLNDVPGTGALLRAYLDDQPGGDGTSAVLAANLARWYAVQPAGMAWHGMASSDAPQLDRAHRERLAELLLRSHAEFRGSEAARANIERLRHGAAAVVTGQQVGLFGGPLLTLMKAATAVARAREATAATGREHVPVFWLASEDHDIDEVDRVTLPRKGTVVTQGAHLQAGHVPMPVGRIKLGDRALPVLAWAEDVLNFAPVCDWLREAYTDAPGYEATLASAFGRLLSRIFAAEGLVVMDAASRGFHELGRAPLRYAIEHAEQLESALLERTRELEAAGFAAQVLVAPGHSLLFLVSSHGADVQVREPLRRVVTPEGAAVWRAGAQQFTTVELLLILDTEPERLSPNALLRPVFEDAVLPTAAYIGGPAELAYFAQSEVVYRAALGRVTPVLPRLSATLVSSPMRATLAAHELSLPALWAAQDADALALKMGARAMPIEGKRKLAAAGNAMGGEVGALVEYMAGLDAELGRAAGVSASKMLYQMNRLRRMAARFELERHERLRKDAAAVMAQLYPDRHLQERVLAGVWALAAFGEALVPALVAAAAGTCTGHVALEL